VELYSHEPDEIWRMHMAAEDRLKLARAGYEAYESGDRGVIEELLTDDFTFYSPADVGIDRASYFERCWPNAELIKAFEFDRLVEVGDEVWVYFHGPQRFENGVYVKGFVQEVDVANRDVYIRVRNHSVGAPLTDDVTSRRIAEVVAPR